MFQTILASPTLFVLLATIITPPLATTESIRSDWLSDSDRNQFLKRWFENRRSNRASSFDASSHQFKGCVDPSEPFQCPLSETCIALQFICDGNPGDCPGNTDENEETCIAAKRPAKENIEKFLTAEHTLHGLKLFNFLFGEKVGKRIDENNVFWFDVLASAFSVSKNLRSFGEKTRMTADDLAHFRSVIETIHDGRLEDIPMFAQEAVNQGLASLIEKLYESGFMDP